MTAMNLGDSNLRYVNTSRPQLIHSNSKQSVTASDDYYSTPSEGSSHEEKEHGVRYDTPPTHMRPDTKDSQQSEKTLPTIRPVKEKVVGFDERSTGAATEGLTIKRKPVSSSSSDGTVIRRSMNDLSPPTPGVDDTPYIHFAIDQLTRDEEVVGSRSHSISHSISGDEAYPTEGDVEKQRHQRRIPHPPPIPPSSEPRSSPIENVLVPTQPAKETFRYPKLHFVPGPLHTISLSVLIVCCLLMMIGLAFCGAYPLHHDGLFDYDGTGTSRYFVFQYLPQILGSVIIIWLVIIQYTLQRVYPFVALASGPAAGSSEILYDFKLFPTNLLIPNLSYVGRGGPWLALWAITLWLAMFTIPLQSCLFQARYFVKGQIWRWTTVQPIAWILFGIYFLLILGLAALMLRFTIGETGLKWDPTSLADFLAIFHRANFLNDFDRSEIEASVARPPKDIRLGYWRNSKQGAETFYCIGDENAPVRRYSLERGKMRLNEKSIDLESQHPSSYRNDIFRGEIHNPTLRYRWVPWFLRDTFVVAWIVIAFVLLVAFLVVSFVNNAAEMGFLPQLPSPTTPFGFSPADFLYSFIPSLLGMILFLVWQPFDAYFRALQPFASLSGRGGSSAEKSLLLDYGSCLPLQVTFRALVAGHFRVAWISFVSLISITIPILAGGVFTAQYIPKTGQVVTAASKPGFEALVVFVIIYVLSFLVLFPTKRRHLPHGISTLGELVSFFYQSPLLAEETFEEPRSKIDLITKLLGTPLDEKMSSRYAFGIYMGQDGKEHLGIDRLERPGYGEMLVDFR
ncbi:uncharacterized protein KY384_001040 [Bacidia gigantensis]|uniref:uncharacterized protein n=1 Tax=Bacidia gigantensis TaxID=2732470 RepID=UPI001D037346|nr:uncharacterized protein KY384_001040 [Bacidia gigantensis]KAG8534196.1 hypothetical protein KY384_001040 [Bacidia gigantensis]